MIQAKSWNLSMFIKSHSTSQWFLPIWWTSDGLNWWNELLELLYFPPGIVPCNFGIHVQQTRHLNTEGKMSIILFDLRFWMSVYRCEKAYDFPWYADRSVREKRTTDGYWHSGRSGHFYVRGENIAKSDLSISFDYIIIIYQVINLNALLKCIT